jgi:SAM-dependent methyltransferase
VTDAVRAGYDRVAKQYAELFLGDLEDQPFVRKRLTAFANQVAPGGLVADLGCGPGHVSNFLTGLGLTTVGYDLSPATIDEARQAFPELDFHVGDLTALGVADHAFAGIIARYSIIHMDPGRLGDAFGEWMRVLTPGAPVYVSFFSALTPEGHGEAFDHAAVTAYGLFPDDVVAEMRAAGFEHFDVAILPPPGGGRPFEQAKVLARRGRR